MILTDEEVEERLNSNKNLCVVIEKSRGGRGKGDTGIPESVRDLIAITEGRQKDISEEFLVDQSSVSEIKKGLVGGRLDSDLSEVGKIGKRNTEKLEEDAHDAALNVLMTSLGMLQPKLADPDLKAKDLSKIASDMAKVSRDMKGTDRSGITNNTQVILLAPPRKTLEKYEVIEA